jgi:hypothetical protein
MKNWLKTVLVATALMGCCVTSTQAQQDGQGRGQGRGNFDPEEMRARMMERTREQFGVTDDAEWKVIEAKITKVNEARRAVGGGFGGEPSPEVEDLRKAIEAKAPAAEIKAKLAKVREVRKANEAKLEAAQEDLRKILSVQQEAVAVMAGLLK